MTDEEQAKKDRDKTIDLIFAIYRVAIKNYNYTLSELEEEDFLLLLDYIIFDVANKEENEEE